MQTSARFGIVYPSADRSDSADIPRDVIAVVNGLEANSAMYGQGTLALRPTSSAGTPGKQGRFYMATDQTPHVLYYDYGTGWDSVGAIAAGAIGTTQLADGSVTGGPAGAGVKLAAATITHDNIVAGTIRGGGNEISLLSISAGDLVAGLKPSQGAAGGTEALRAIGAGAGQVVAGNDSRLSDTRVPATGHDPSAFGTALPTTGLSNGYVFSLFLADATSGYRVYNAIYRADLDATYPWHVTGVAMVSEVDASESSVSTTYAALATAGPSITAARAGVYRIEIWSAVVANANFTGGTFHSFDIGGTGAADADAAFSNVSGGGTAASAANYRSRVKTLATPGTALVSKYRGTGNSTIWENRGMALTPIKII